jgi:hypothetical protein
LHSKDRGPIGDPVPASTSPPSPNFLIEMCAHQLLIGSTVRWFLSPISTARLM